MGKNLKTDISTAAGISLALLLVALAISSGGSILAFFDLNSVFIVIGGTVFLTMACFTLSDLTRSLVLVFKTIFYHQEDPAAAAIKAINLAEIARKEGILALQKHEDMFSHNRFLNRGVGYIIDGLQSEESENFMKEEINSMIDRHKKGVAVLKKAAEIAPAMGLIGTLVGLVQMLGNLSDPSTIGPAMAVALLTTLYGALLSFMVFLPIATKLERVSKDEANIMDIYLLSVRSISRKESPRRLEMLINSILSPAHRVDYFFN